MPIRSYYDLQGIGRDEAADPRRRTRKERSLGTEASLVMMRRPQLGTSEPRLESEEQLLAEAVQQWEMVGVWTSPEKAAAEEVARMAGDEPACWKRRWAGMSGGQAGEGEIAADMYKEG